MTITEQLRQAVRERANSCCEYCLIAPDKRFLPHSVDHIIARKHSGSDEIDNLCYACYKCNSFKGSNVAGIDPKTNEAVLLFNPRTQKWSEHFQLELTGHIKALTPVGVVTLFVLRINDDNRVRQRKSLTEIEKYPCKKSN